MLKIASQSIALSTGKSDGNFQKADTTMLKRSQMTFLSFENSENVSPMSGESNRATTTSGIDKEQV